MGKYGRKNYYRNNSYNSRQNNNNNSSSGRNNSYTKVGRASDRLYSYTKVGRKEKYKNSWRGSRQSSRHYSSNQQESSTDVVTVYTDGSCLSNGSKQARGGIGLYFGENDERNVSEPMQDNKVTNNRAELRAIERALEIVDDDQEIEIRSDSKYAMQAVTEWLPKWKRNGWKTSSNKDVSNKEIITSIDGLIEQRSARTNFKHVPGHSGHNGNEQADQLAVDGAKRYNNPHVKKSRKNRATTRDISGAMDDLIQQRRANIDSRYSPEEYDNSMSYIRSDYYDDSSDDYSDDYGDYY